MKRAIIVHCWEGAPEYCWYPHVKKELQDLGFQVEVPAMPETNLPQQDKWLPKLQEVVGDPDEELYLIGHSLGCVTIMRYLEGLPDGKKIGGVVLVAGFIDDLGFKEISNFFLTPINFEKINASAKKFTFIHSDNDPYVDLKYGKLLQEKLGGELIVKKGMKHFSGAIDDEEACLALPDVVEAIKKMA